MKEFNAISAYMIEIYSFLLELPFGILVVPILSFIIALLFNYLSKRSCSMESLALLFLSFSMLLLFYAMVMNNEVLYMSGSTLSTTAGSLRSSSFISQTLFVFFICFLGFFYILPIFLADKVYNLVLKLKYRSKNK